VPASLATRAETLRAQGDAEGALEALDALVREAPGFAPVHDARAVLLAEAGRLDDAREAYARALALDPRFARAHFGLASLGATSAQRVAMETLAANPAGLDAEARLFLLYGLVRAYDEAGDFPRAFVAAEAGAKLRRARWAGDEAAELQRLAEAGPRAAPDGEGDAAPIFVFGMPRSGTTLVEQILAGHPEVAALGETEIFEQRADLAVYRGRGRVVDKSLGNFLHIPAIRRAFPRARLVHVRRDALDCCLSIHFCLFSGDMPFPPDLAGLGRYYRGYERLMEAWRAEGVIHEVRYERVVADLEGETRALLAYCGLVWDARCLAFHENRRRVVTASLAQVRKPLYASSVGRARNYAPFLAPLREALRGETS
jgi:tetratricopeptide (TPR) repeat protein